MSSRSEGAGPEPSIDRWDGGASWVAHPDETMQRASHLLVDSSAPDDLAYLVDPVDIDGLRSLVDEYGSLAGIVLLLDRHTRDVEMLANSLEVPVMIPAWMSRMEETLSVPVERLGDRLGGYRVLTVVDNRLWQEAALYNPDSRVLLAPESLGTASYYRAPAERVGVHPARRITPPTALGEYPVDHLLTGHGPAVHSDASSAVREAISGSRSRAPSLYLNTLRDALSL